MLNFNIFLNLENLWIVRIIEVFLIWNKGSGNWYMMGEAKLAWIKEGMVQEFYLNVTLSTEKLVLLEDVKVPVVAIS